MRTQRTRHVLVIVAIAAALCADQVVSAAPLARPLVADMAGLVGRLRENLRPPVASTLPRQVRQPRPVSVAKAADPIQVRQSDGLTAASLQSAHPFQFRLPPPVNA